MIQLTIKELLWMLGGGLGVIAILAAVVRFLASTWVKARIENSVRAEYDRLLSDYKYELGQKLEDYRNDAKIRERAAGVVTMLSYVRKMGDLEDPKFIKKAWELSLWLPADIYAKLKDCAYGDGSDKDVKEVLLATRKILLGDKAGVINPDDIPPSVERVDHIKNPTS